MLLKLLESFLFLIKHNGQLIYIPLIFHSVVINLKWPILRRQGIQYKLNMKNSSTFIPRVFN